MKHDENLNKQPHWRCRLCGHSTPLGQAVCSNPSCRADLGIYGEAVTPGKEADGHSAWKQRQEEARQREYDQRQTAEEKRRRAEEKARDKAAKRAARSGSGAPKWLIPALAAVLVAFLGIGAGVFFAGRSTAGNPVPPRSSAGPGPGSAQPEGSGALESDTPGPDESQPDLEETPTVCPWTGNVLMADHIEGAYNENDAAMAHVFQRPISRGSIVSVTFMDSLDDMHGDSWDVSQAQDGSVMAWTDSEGSTRRHLYIGALGGVEAPEDCARMFDGYVDLESITFNGAFHTDHVTDMSWMFKYCGSLTELDVSGFDTSHAKSMNAMFSGCSSVTELDVSGFDTSHAKDMSAMFSNCSSVAELDVSGFDTSNVTDMDGMFGGCSGLTALDLRNFDTSNVTNMSGMFNGCRGLRELDVISFDTSSVTDMQYMFKDCYGLTELDITNFKTSNVKNMSHMFAGVNSGFALHFVRANFDTSNVENYEGFMDDSFDWRKMFE